MERCLTLGCPEAVRLSLQDPCTGEKVCGEDNGYVLSCIRNWSIEPIVREGEASEFTADCGNMVIRDRQDDQLLGYTISFETSTRSNELEALVTGKERIESDGSTIGTYGVGSNLGCSEPSDDPRFVVEGFYKLSRCIDGADHVRWVLPMAQFKVTEIDREGSITFYRYMAETSSMVANALGDGPFGDFPADVTAFLAARDPDELTTGIDWEETITIAGSCGTVEVTCLVSGIFIDQSIAAGQPDSFFKDIACDSSSKYVAAGTVGDAGVLNAAIYRFTSDGELDITFGGGDGKALYTSGTTYDDAVGVAVDPTDASYVVLTTIDAGGTPDAAILRFTSAGVLDLTWGVAGVVTIGAANINSPTTMHGIHVEASGEIVVGWRDAAGDGHISRLTSAGAPQDDVVFTGNDRVFGLARISDGMYAAGVYDDATGTIYASIADLVLGTHTDSLTIPTTAFIYTALWQNVGVAVDALGRIYLSGTDNFGEPHVKVARFDALLVLDPVWGGGGIISIEEPTWDSSEAVDVIVLASGDVVVSGRIVEGLEQHWLVAMVDTTGALIPTFGTAGIAEFLIGTNVISHSTSLVACGAETRIVSAGIAYDAQGYPALIGQLTSNGALDTTFGEP